MQVFEGPDFSGSRFLKVQIFQGPGFSVFRSRVRVQVLQVAEYLAVWNAEKPFDHYRNLPKNDKLDLKTPTIKLAINFSKSTKSAFTRPVIYKDILHNLLYP